MGNGTLFFFSYVALWLITGLLYVAVFLLYRHFGQELLERRNFQERLGPKLNEKANMSFKTVDGTDYNLFNGRSHVFLFAAPNCQLCEAVKPLIKGLSARPDIGTIVIYAADEKATRDYTAAISGIAVSDAKREISKAWNVRSTPYFVVTDSQAVVRKKGGGNNPEAIAQYFDTAISG